MVLRIKIKETRFYLRHIETRLPFRFGAYTLREVPLLHLALEAESEGGTRVRGFAADNLMPKWFDKDPAKAPIDNINDLLSSVRIARHFYAESGRNQASVWGMWREAYPLCLRRGENKGLNALVASFGSSLFERALLDALGKIAERDLIGILRENIAGIRPEDIHRELRYEDILSWAAEDPPSTLMVRHTVGLLDPLEADDLDPETSPQDGLPHTLEEYIVRNGLRGFKIKIRGEIEADLDRLRRIAAVLDRLVSQPCLVTLDGNEQYRSIAEFRALMHKMAEDPRLKKFYHAMAFVEQPLDRANSLRPDLRSELADLAKLRPVIIDESDDHLDAFKTAAALGYRGVSTKNCKGVMKSFLNRSLIAKWNQDRPANDRFFMTAEDLTNVPIVPLQQDLTVVRALKVPHLERNGYHYGRGLSHCSSRERELALRHHPDLYEGDQKEAFVRISDGRIRVDSLAVPGLGVAFDPDFESMAELSLDSSSPIMPGKDALA
jgi:hypothetical protein